MPRIGFFPRSARVHLVPERTLFQRLWLKLPTEMHLACIGVDMVRS
ncbi:MAG: hypothetical protein JWO59_2187 [Chloroflexi bacterium]|nr:hypothetical protein [Chloroflexota bacterium]